ncbi:MAG TPA: hypothetical protein VEK76_10020 [Candidatus Binatia bacterium]|nr:hypothetical protein [Candidatus Binatia bacterium]
MRERDEYESGWAELGRRRLAGELSTPEASALALTSIRRIAQRIVASDADLLRAAVGIYFFAWFGGDWDDDQPAEELKHWGAEFIQLADALECNQDDEASREAWTAFIRKAATAGLAGEEFPAWSDAPSARPPHRGFPEPEEGMC